jgi:hypothetical protein
MAMISVHRSGKTCERPLARNSRRTSGSRRIPPHGARPPREPAARGARSQASDLGTNGDRPATSRAWPCKLAPRIPPWSRAARTSPPTSLEPSEIRSVYDRSYATQLLHNMENKDWQRRDVWVRVGLIAMKVTGASCTRGSWDPFAPQPDVWAQKAGRLFLTSPALLTLEVSPLPPRVPPDRHRPRPPRRRHRRRRAQGRRRARCRSARPFPRGQARHGRPRPRALPRQAVRMKTSRDTRTKHRRGTN